DPRSMGRRRRSGWVLVIAACVIAVLTGLQDVVNVSLGIDQVLFGDQVRETAAVIAGRMSPLTSASLGLVGLAVVVGTRAPRLAITLSGIVMFVAVLNVFTFLFEAAVPPFLAGYTQMAPTTAVGLAFLGVGAVGMLGRGNPIALIADRSTVATVLRRLLAVLIVVPVILSWLRLEGQRLGLYDTSY